MKNNPYQLITDRIIECLDKGTAPWRKPWATDSIGLGDHKNIASLKEYRGVNALMTFCAGQSYSSRFWGTYKQWQDIGGNVKKGEKSIPVVYFQFGEKELEDGTKEEFGFAKHSNVFNSDQVEGIESIKKLIKPAQIEAKTEFQKIQSCESLLDAFFESDKKLTLKHQGHRACYMPMRDTITMPEREAFAKSTDYYATLFHELGHATGHESRLARPSLCSKIASFGSHEYSKEELVAELTSAFLCGHTQIDAVTLDQSASYIQSWLNVLKNNPPKFIAEASSQAQKAADLILGKVQS